MAPLKLEGETLGQKHRHFNSLVKVAVADQAQSLEPIDYSEPDVSNLLRIDVACARRDVPHVLEVLRSPDLLYVTRAIKRSTWLITDPQYTHIINPGYLERELFPYMIVKAKNKLMISIQRNLKEETRTNTFFNYYKNDPRIAMKWMNGSLNIGIKFVQEHTSVLNRKQLIRLCRKSIIILEAYCKQYQGVDAKEVLEEATNLLHDHCNHYLDIVDFVGYYYKPKFKKKATKIIMNKCRERIINNFDDYYYILHIPTFAKNLKPNEVKDFLIKQKQNKCLDYWFNFENTRHFLKNVPKDRRLDFIKSLFTKTGVRSGGLENDNCTEPEDLYWLIKGDVINSNVYKWYSCLPFDIAMSELKKRMSVEIFSADRCEMLKVLTECAGSNQEQLRMLLEYYRNHHINDPFKFKKQFVYTFLSHTKTYEFDIETWIVLNNIFLSMDVYVDVNNRVQPCIIAIILFKVLNDQSIPEIVENKFDFSTLKNIRHKLDQHQQTKVFNYLLVYLMKELQSRLLITNENELTGVVDTLDKMLTLLVDWDKSLEDYPFIINEIKNVIKVKREKCWNIDLSTLYKSGKQSRKYFFEESLLLHSSYEAYLNALKHDFELLSRYRNEVEAMFLNSIKSMEKLLRKIRIYWSESITQQWTDFFLIQVEQLKNQRFIKHLFMLMPHHKVIRFIEKHASIETETEKNGNNEWKHMLRKNISKYMHLVRLPVSIDTILLYAKSNYLGSTMPSLNAVLYNMSADVTSKHLAKLLNAPVSLQKHGIRTILKKLKICDIKESIGSLWNTTNNVSLKAVVLRHTFELLCKTKNDDSIKCIWELMAMFIESMTSQENRVLYGILAKLRLVPKSVRPVFIMKGYLYLQSLPAKSDTDKIISLCYEEAPLLVEMLEPHFVEEELLKCCADNFLDVNRSQLKEYEILAAFIISGKTEEIQMLRYEKLLLPILENGRQSWNLYEKGRKTVMKKLNSISFYLVKNLVYRTVSNQNIVPVKLFKTIRTELSKSLFIDDNYEISLTWNIATLFVEMLDVYVNENPQVYIEEAEPLIQATSDWICSNIMPFGFIKNNNQLWKEICQELAEPFGKACASHLKQDTILNKYPALFTCVKDVLSNIILAGLDFENKSKILFLKAMISDCDLSIIYCVVISYLRLLNFYDNRNLEKELLKILSSSNSIDVKILLSYYEDNKIPLGLESEDEEC